MAEDPPVRLKIKRRSGDDRLPWWQEIEVPFDEQRTILDTLRAIDPAASPDGAPAVCEPCADQKCGACAMLINNEPLLACRLKQGEIEEPIEVRALETMPGARDLLVDQESIRKRAGELPSAGCIDCGLCLDACPSFDRAQPFAGPAALFRAEAAGASAADLRGLHFWECDSVGNCSAVCPEKLPVADAIARVKRRALLGK